MASSEPGSSGADNRGFHRIRERSILDVVTRERRAVAAFLVLAALAMLLALVVRPGSTVSALPVANRHSVPCCATVGTDRTDASARARMLARTMASAARTAEAAALRRRSA